MSQAFLGQKGIRRMFLRSSVLSSSPSRHLSFALQRELDVLLRRLLCLLDEAVQQDHMAIAHAEDHPRDPVAIKVASYFPQADARLASQTQPSECPSPLSGGLRQAIPKSIRGQDCGRSR